MKVGEGEGLAMAEGLLATGEVLTAMAMMRRSIELRRVLRAKG